MALVLVLGVGAAIPAASAPVEALGGAAQRAAPVGVGAGVGVLGAASSPFTVGGRALTPVALTATSLSIPILDGRLVLGTWQGIYLWEHRHRAGARRLVIHVGA